MKPTLDILHKSICRDIVWLKKQPGCEEKLHIHAVLRCIRRNETILNLLKEEPELVHNPLHIITYPPGMTTWNEWENMNNSDIARGILDRIAHGISTEVPHLPGWKLVYRDSKGDYITIFDGGDLKQ